MFTTWILRWELHGFDSDSSNGSAVLLPLEATAWWRMAIARLLTLCNPTSADHLICPHTHLPHRVLAPAQQEHTWRLAARSRAGHTRGCAARTQPNSHDGACMCEIKSRQSGWHVVGRYTCTPIITIPRSCLMALQPTTCQPQTVRLHAQSADSVHMPVHITIHNGHMNYSRNLVFAPAPR